jgi:transcriptional regulator with XRE-family HTH domain
VSPDAARPAGDPRGSERMNDSVTKLPGLVRNEASAIGHQIRRLRTNRGLSLQDLSASANVAVGLLSQIERGVSSPSLRTLTKLRLALDVPMSALFEPPHKTELAEAKYIRRGENRAVVDLGPDKMVKELLSPNNNGALQLMLLIIPPRGGAGDETYSYGGEKAGVVLEGFFKLRIAGETFDLRKNDSFHFDSSLPHTFENPTDAETRVLWAVCKPVTAPAV